MKNLLLFLTVLLSGTVLAQTTETEPNNSFNQANAITLGTSFKTSLNPASNPDYFKVTVPRPGILEMVAENVPANVGVQLKLFDASNQELASEYNTPGKNSYLSGYVCAAGTYYVVVQNAYNSANPETFDVKVTLNETDAFECNNSFTTAKELNSAQAVKIALHPSGDVDYFKISVTKPGVLEMAAENVPPAVAVRLRLYDAATKEVVSDYNNQGKNLYLNALVCDPGTYYVVAENIFNNSPSPTTFDFKVTLNTTDVFECNNSFTAAKEIQSGQLAKIAIHPQGDQDYFKIAIKKPGVLGVYAENVPASVYTRLFLYNPANQRITVEAFQQGTNGYLSALVCEQGTYYALIENYFGQGSANLFDFKLVNDTTDVYECNNSFVQAKEIQVDKPIKAAINAQGDLDFFKFTLGSKTTLNFTVSDVPAEQYMYLEVFNATQNRLQNVNGQQGTALSLKKYALDAGTYYVKLSGYSYDPKLYSFAVARDTVLPPTLKANLLSICPGAEVRLTAEGCLGVVKWSNSQTGLTITVKPTAVTTYTAVCEDGGRTSANSLPLIVTMKPVPTATASATNGGTYYETQTIELSSGGGTAYAWTGPLSFRSPQQNPKIPNANVNMTGAYQVSVTNTEGCTATAQVSVKVELITALEPTPSGLRLDVSPNPAGEACQVRFSLAEPARAEISLLNASGKTIATWTSSQAARLHETTFPLRGLATGMYLIQALADDQKLVKKLLKSE